MFDDLTPRELKIFQRAHEKQFVEIDRYLHRSGWYVMNAMAVVMTNSFSDKGKHVDYMKYSISDQKEFDELEQEDKNTVLRKQYAMELSTLRANFRLTKIHSDATS